MTTSNKYKEAIQLTDKLKAKALKEAQEQIAKALEAPIKAALHSDALILEQEEQEVPVEQVPAPQTPEVPPVETPPVAQQAPVSEPTAAPAAEPPPAKEMPPATEQPPVVPAASSGLGMPMPDAQGKITVNFEDLWSAQAEEAPAKVEADAIGAMPAAGAGEPSEIPTEQPAAPASGTPEAPATPETPPTPEEQQLAEATLQMKVNEFVTMAKLEEDKDVAAATTYGVYEWLQTQRHTVSETAMVKLEETLEKLFEEYSYEPMATKNLAQFAKKLFEGTETALPDGDLHTKSSAGFGDGDSVAPGVKNSNEKPGPSAAAMRNSKSKIEDPGKTASLKAGAVQENADLDADAAQIEEQIREMMGADDTDMVEESPVEVVKENLRKELKALQERQQRVAKALKECGEGVTVNIEVNGEPVASVGPDGSVGMSGESEDDDDTFEIVDDEEDGEMDDDDMPMEEPEEEEDLEVSTINESQTEITLAKSLYLNKVYGLNENLNRQTKARIAGFFDKARTLAEAKAVYNRVVKTLNESKVKAKTLAEGASRKGGSSSKPTRSGSTAKPLNEGTSAAQRIGFDTARWQKLAGISG
jgi:hypothetical protein